MPDDPYDVVIRARRLIGPRGATAGRGAGRAGRPAPPAPPPAPRGARGGRAAGLRISRTPPAAAGCQVPSMNSVFGP
ncbi:hypothetical protein, partial [Saccharopolyspora sp. 6V]|uniref:hypothetical protein n=1 Tax=Saccharopolyspora sp. 6V TaxID=2877239 RepID=UPI001CD2DAF0